MIALAEGEAQRARALVRKNSPGSPRVTGTPCSCKVVLTCHERTGRKAGVGTPARAVIRTQREGSDGVHFAVQDSGIGIDPQVAQRIFEAFYSTKDHGMGMGLSISRSIVEQHGGRLWAAPNDGPGTTFHVTL